MRDGASSAEEIGKAILDWYDVHARNLPWRVGPVERKSGVAPDPYRVWLSEVMLQQTTVAAVSGYFVRFTERWPDVATLAAAEDADVMAAWAGLGYYARARNLLRCARAVAGDLGGVFPADRDGLLALPGIGPYTAAAIAAIAYDHPEPVVDGNVERVTARLFDVRTPLPAAKSDLRAHAAALTPALRPGDHAQAMMDLGATICTSRAPACGICPLRGPCRARAAGTAPDLPGKAPKPAKPVRRGFAYVGRRADGAMLVETRPASGLLGGMLGWPGSEWNDQPEPAPPCDADWRVPVGEVRHTFTHFHLILTVFRADLSQGAHPDRGHFIDRDRFQPTDMPTVMRKAFDLCHGS